ncbi:MAG: hypothetical protein JW821_08340 [Deltaproteobacteria bacterium]|nr:hypothetical protein [Deltaproteobacteria bacterium]
MKIKVESDRIIKALKKLDGIEMVLENAEDAKEALGLIFRKKGLFSQGDFERLLDVKVASFQEYATSAVDYRMVFLLEFVFEENTSMEEKVAIIKSLQDFFTKV